MKMEQKKYGYEMMNGKISQEKVEEASVVDKSSDDEDGIEKIRL